MSQKYYPSNKFSPLLAYLFISTACIVLYWKGLYGPFIMDDYPNLQPLSFFGGITDWQSALYFTFSNNSGPLGRPISMASFLLHDIAWPSSTFSFKFANLMFHSINGLLIFWLSTILFHRHRHAHLWAFAIAAIWLLHPFHTSSVLYVVQRMTLLSSLFMLASLIYYTKWRSHLNEATTYKNISLFVFNLSIFGSLGLLSKETAVSVIFYIALLEYLWFEKPRNIAWNKVRHIVILIPSLLIITYIAYKGMSSENSWATRSFNMQERLLTELRIIVDYLYNIIIPHSRNTGIFHDDWIHSTSLVAPLSTLLSFILLSALLILSVVAIKKHKPLAFGVLWFFSGHILESTFLPLELYFEHRNYLPMLGLIISLLYIFSRMKPIYMLASISIYVSLSVFVLTTQIKVWSNQELMTLVWAKEHTNSQRAQETLIQYALKNNDADSANSLISDILKRKPNSHISNLNKIIINCATQQAPVNIEKLTRILSNGPAEIGVAASLHNLRGFLSNVECNTFSWPELRAITEALISNPSYDSSRNANALSYIYKELAMQGREIRDLNLAVSSLEKAFEAAPNNISFPLTQVSWLLDAGLTEEAQHFLDIAKNIKTNNVMLAPMHKKLILEVEKQFNGRN